MDRTYVTRAVSGNRIWQIAALPCLFFVALVMGFLAIISPTNAHEVRPSIVDMSLEDGRAVLIIETNLEAWLADIGDDHENTEETPQAAVYDRLRALSPEELETEFNRQQAGFLDAVSLVIGGTAVAFDLQSLEVPAAPDLALARTSLVTLASSSAIDAQAEATIAFTERFSETIIRVNGPDGTTVYSEFLSGDMATAPFAIGALVPQSGLDVLPDYVGVGFEHIVPLGLDHILFVIGLYLFAGRLGPLLWQVTAFTLAHSVTLALGATGLISLNSWIVESIIAASIVYVGLENIFLKDWARHRIALVFAFGLLHGLGFAGVLGEFGLPDGQFVPALIGFNVGVEFGQLAVIAACFALTFWARNQSWYRSVVVIPLSAVIALIGAYWVLERTGILPETMGGLF